MENITVAVPSRYIAAALLFAAKSDLHYYLNGILLEIGAKEMRIVATDGRALFVARVAHDTPLDLTEPVSVIAPRNLFEGIKNIPLSLEIGPPDENLQRLVSVRLVIPSGESRVGKSIAGHFPDWRRVIPTSASGETAQFTPSIVAIMAKARKTLGGNPEYLHIEPNGTGIAWADPGDTDCFVVLMPMKSGKPLTFPNWIADDLKTTEAAELT